MKNMEANELNVVKKLGNNEKKGDNNSYWKKGKLLTIEEVVSKVREKNILIDWLF